MNNFSYTVEANPGAPAIKTKTQNLTGTTNVTFWLGGLSAYDLATASRLNKVIVNFDDEKELVFDRAISDTTISTVSTITFDHTLQTDFIDKVKRNVYFTLQRDDLTVETVHVKFTMYKPPITEYEDINLIKTDFFTTDENDEKLLLTFINKNPEVLGINVLDLNADVEDTYNPDSTDNKNINVNKLNVGFSTEYVQLDSSLSNSGSKIIAELNPQTGMPRSHGNVTLKFRTRGNPQPIGQGLLALPGTVNTSYIPLSANSAYFQLSGYLNWNCGDLLKDYYLKNKVISIPLADITGTRDTLHDYHYYFTNVNVGAGATATSQVSGGYFMVDLYDITACDTITTTVSTLTAFVNYDV